MKKEEIFELWGKIINGDRESKARFVGFYLSKFPHNSFLIHMTPENEKQNLHIMYLHLTK